MVTKMPTNSDQPPTIPFSSGQNASGSTIITPTPSSYIPIPTASGSQKETSRSNAHPYPIKTTSSALLSRSNSLTADTNRHLASALRYIPPASPSPTSSRLSFSGKPISHARDDSSNAVENDDIGASESGRGSRLIGRKHRYSRSLTASTEDLPRPLPAPPSFGFRGSTFVTPGRMSTSPTRTSDTGLPDHAEYTPLDDGADQEGLRTVKPKDIFNDGGRARAETLPTFAPSSAPAKVPRRAYKAPSVDVDLDISSLPPNPKDWTPSQLSIYLARALRNRDGESLERLPSRVVEDIAAFVREKRMWGRTFLRLEDEDLERYVSV
ncbi:hypothetical protein BDN72DRAFT_305824 [Pluteus cervinus]|uniref:Uncharacterized protein n=1 Tax=Pluteus cervinus TaxID=181527 RepID=A0ACD3AD96_9AGAR|nr:hypothetical protein BDN72DRAFT_305824 [Pluteus cervinus]